MKKSAAGQPVLKQFANLWTLVDYPSRDREWSLEEKFRQVKKGGFDAVGSSPRPGLQPLCEKYGMEYVCSIDANGSNYAARLAEAQEAKPVRVNVQLCDHDTPPREAVRVWLKLEALAVRMGLHADLEVHRDTCTETPEKVYEIAALFRRATGRDLRFCWDFSHIAAVKHLNPPYAERLLTHPKLVRLARQMHFRPFNGHHAQVPMTDGKGHESPEGKDYLEFLDALLGCWMAGAKGGEVLYVCPENGPRPGGYALSCFPDVWKDAIYLREQTARLWAKNLRAWKRPASKSGQR